LIEDNINFIANLQALQLKGNFLTSQEIALGVQIATSKGGNYNHP